MSIDVRSLASAVLKQSFADAEKQSQKKHQNPSKIDCDQARSFLTGNYSREMLEFYSECIGASPNYIICMAMRKRWSKSYIPKYFN